METKKVEKLESGRNYQFNMDEKDSFILLNGAVIHKGVIDELIMLQREDPNTNIFNNDGYREVAAIFAEVFSYVAYSSEYTNEDEKVLRLLHHLHWHLTAFKNISLTDSLMSILINNNRQ